jgi:hypothetical protein
MKNVNVTTMPVEKAAQDYDRSIGEDYQPQQYITITNPFAAANTSNGNN